MSFITKDKTTNTIFNQLKISIECNEYHAEICSDNGLEFKNLTIEKYLKDNNIKFLYDNPYNPHSQGVVERFHQKLKGMLYKLYFEENNNLNLKDCLDIVLKKYNNHIHLITQMTPNEVFYSKSEDVFVTILNNIKKSFKNVGKDFYNFSGNE